MKTAENAGTLREQVTKFHRAFGHPVREVPGLIPDERVRLRARLIAEEFFEVLEACFTGEHKDTIGRALNFDARSDVLSFIDKSAVRVDLPELADGLADLDYVVEGTRLEFGINGAPIAAEVHRANITKRGGGKREDGKVLKPEGWCPPDIDGELRKQGWTP
jgi:predicted HAD superfamily Cof-like phosphohydrolase